jgi:hypothetical protein
LQKDLDTRNTAIYKSNYKK